MPFGGEPGAGLALRDGEPLKCFELERDDAEGIAGRDRLRLCAFEQVGLCEAEHAGDLGAVVQISEDSIVLPHGGEDAAVSIRFRLETNGDCADVEQQLELACADERRMVEDAANSPCRAWDGRQRAAPPAW